MPQQVIVDLPKSIPLAVVASNRANDPDKDGRLINGYLEKVGDSFQVYKRPGMVAVATYSVPAGTGRGSFVWNGDLFRVVGDRLYKNATNLGAVNANGKYSFVTCLGGTPRIILGNGIQAYSYSTSTGLLPLGGTQPPVNVLTGWAYVDGTIYYLTPDAHVYGSGINDPNTWDAVNFLAAHIEPDNGVHLARNLSYVVALKEFTTEIFRDVGNPTGSPLGPVQGAKINWGCASANSVIDIDGDLYWLGITRGGSAQVVVMRNLKVELISTPPVDRLFADSASGTIYAWSYKQGGHTFYVLTSVTQNVTMAYDISQNVWTQWTDSAGNYLPIVSAVSKTDQSLLQHISNGKTYSMSQVYTTDDGSVITWELYTPNFDAGVDRRKQLNMLRLVCDRTAGSTVTIRCNDFDYDPAKWTAWRTLDLSVQRPMLPACGTFYRRAYHLKHTSATQLRVVSLDVQIELGTL